MDLFIAYLVISSITVDALSRMLQKLPEGRSLQIFLRSAHIVCTLSFLAFLQPWR